MSVRTLDFSKTKALLPIYLPWLLSYALQGMPELSYGIAWLGSFFIFYTTILSRLRFTDPNLLIHQQLMRPIVLIQLVFAGFMSCSSIFYFMDFHDYYFFNQMDDQIDPPDAQIYRIPQSQRLCLLAHCALVSGIFLTAAPSSKPTYRLTISTDRLLAGCSIISYISAFLLSRFPGSVQFALLLFNLSLFSGAVLLIRGMQQKHFINCSLGGAIFLFSLCTQLFTGYKEAIIVHLILLSFLLYTAYRKATLYLLIPLSLALGSFLPSFTKNIRKLAWTEHRKLSGFQQTIYLSLLEQSEADEWSDNNWEFLSNRSSEIGMFTQYLKKVPEERPYYHWEILQNAIQALIPRVLWPDKPNTEKVAMKRVYDLGVASRMSTVSAKSRPVVDGYLSAGPTGILIAMFIYGWIAQSLCNTAERWFGGYTLGCTVVFNALFQQLWRGNSFEFLLNNIFYGMLLMTFIFYLFRITNIIIPQSLATKPTHASHDRPHQSIL